MRIKELVEAGVTAGIETIRHGAAGAFADLASNRCVLFELVDELVKITIQPASH